MDILRISIAQAVLIDKLPYSFEDVEYHSGVLKIIPRTLFSIRVEFQIMFFVNPNTSARVALLFG